MIKKKVSPTGQSVRLTFELPGDLADDKAAVLGSFNGWDPEEGAMTYVKSRDVWKAGVTVEPDARYEFRYLVDEQSWHNDAAADAQVGNEFFEQNSVVQV